MKSPDEIKKGLEICSCDEDRDKCVRCPYFDGTCRNDLNAIEKDALALIHQLEALVPSWISVEERLPKRYENVLVTTRFTDEGEPSFGIAYFALSGWKKEEGLLYGKVTHWMPIPEPPEA